MLRQLRDVGSRRSRRLGRALVATSPPWLHGDRRSCDQKSRKDEEVREERERWQCRHGLVTHNIVAHGPDHRGHVVEDVDPLPVECGYGGELGSDLRGGQAPLLEGWNQFESDGSLSHGHVSEVALDGLDVARGLDGLEGRHHLSTFGGSLKHLKHRWCQDQAQPDYDEDPASGSPATRARHKYPHDEENQNSGDDETPRKQVETR